MLELKTSFFLECDPPKTTAQQQKTAVRNGFVTKYDPPKVKQAKTELRRLLAHYAPIDPIMGPIKISIRWVYPLRSSETAKNRRHAHNVGNLPCHTAPDADNLLKGFFDQMQAVGFFKNDSQIYHVDFSKWWGVNPGIRVKIEEFHFPTENQKP